MAVFLDGSPDFVKLAEALRHTCNKGKRDKKSRGKGYRENWRPRKVMLVCEVVVDKDFPTL
ncbi:hypothetical protein [Ruminococcus albus]|uniref:hypothetical protein n=1 Tax=Ruminococcus albus TaxID=1264 RepID=UPI000465AB48|nr:hypothetical protein [Ruminococcus albus]